jgi:septum formation protein
VGVSLILASASPQRRAILERLGVAFTVRPANVVELDHGDPQQVVTENARRKALAVWQSDARPPELREPVLGVDTIVVLGAFIYGKPADEGMARETLTKLAGKTHTVLSGVALLRDGEERVAVAQTQVGFRPLASELIDWYLATGEWRGRAGGYAIQGAGTALVNRIEGDYENVVGLPVATLLDMCPELL